MKRAAAYNAQMLTVRQTEAFSNWISRLRDVRARRKILVRIDRLADGNAGDVAAVGEGVSELRIDYGPGYRVYYIHRGAEIIVLLCGRDKRSQQRDIDTAKRLARDEE